MHVNLLVHSEKDHVPDSAIKVNATSRTKEKWSLELSPFHVGPIKLYDDYFAHNLENAWQYSKVYHEHLGEDGKPTEAYWEWAREGWANPKPVRFPMGRGAIPAGSWWNGRLINYVEARMTIYCPLYAEAVTKTNAWSKLTNLYSKAQKSNVVLAIFDFDGHNSIETFDSFDKLIYNNTMKLGHGFVLAMLLANQRPWEKPYNPELEHYTYIPSRRNSRNPLVASKTCIRVQNFASPITLVPTPVR